MLCTQRKSTIKQLKSLNKQSIWFKNNLKTNVFKNERFGFSVNSICQSVSSRLGILMSLCDIVSMYYKDIPPNVGKLTLDWLRDKFQWKI